jgi:hypothetical protein
MASHLAEMALRKKIAAKSDGYYADTYNVPRKLDR